MAIRPTRGLCYMSVVIFSTLTVSFNAQADKGKWDQKGASAGFACLSIHAQTWPVINFNTRWTDIKRRLWGKVSKIAIYQSLARITLTVWIKKNHNRSAKETIQVVTKRSVVSVSECLTVQWSLCAGVSKSGCLSVPPACCHRGSRALPGVRCHMQLVCESKGEDVCRQRERHSKTSARIYKKLIVLLRRSHVSKKKKVVHKWPETYVDSTNLKEKVCQRG